MSRGGLSWARAALAGVVLIAAGLLAPSPSAADLSDTIARIKPAIVSVGTYQQLRRPPSLLLGTGFAVADGRYVLTCAHAIPEKLDTANREIVAVFTAGPDNTIKGRPVEVVEADRDFDVALLRLAGNERLPPVALARGESLLRDGQAVAFTGFPIVSVLGLYPVTHRGIIAAVTPMAKPPASTRQLDPAMVRRLRNNAVVYQLDATAYPGSSGSPMFLAERAEIYGLVCSAVVRGTKEKGLSEPTGISYAIPISHALELMKEHGVDPSAR